MVVRVEPVIIHATGLQTAFNLETLRWCGPSWMKATHPDKFWWE